MGKQRSKRKWIRDVIIPNGFRFVRSGKHDIYQDSKGRIVPIPHSRLLNDKMCVGVEKELNLTV